MRLRTVVWLAVLLAGLYGAPASAQVHARCSGPVPTGTAPVQAIETTPSLSFEYADADWTGITQANLLVNRIGQATPLSTQVVMKSTITRLGNGNTAGFGCYALPVVPVDQIPRGVPIQFTLSVTGGEPALASGPSNPTDPLGRRLQTGVLRGSAQ
ncbi:MAG TPA: hypothetical protein VGK73_32440 [Polyangiaceae bacterium]